MIILNPLGHNDGLSRQNRCYRFGLGFHGLGFHSLHILKGFTMRNKKHLDHWTVQYPNGHKEYFKDEEEARYIAFMYGIGIVPPLYR
jgi:hypothetical protein